jgi:phospholipase/carboxylesterase
MRLDEDAVIWSAPESERGGRPLLVLLHGYGSHEGDLLQYSAELPSEPVIGSVRAPISANEGWAWFALGEPPTAEADAAADALLDWLDDLEFTSVSTLGFSQGAAVALQALRRRPTQFRSVVALAGFVPVGRAEGDRELKTIKPPVFWGRGALDRDIPAGPISRTENWMAEHTDATIRIYEDLAHSVSADELAEATAFLRTRW